jgi:tRNA-dihydrouridine synthase
VFVHGRTRDARYRRAADWDAIGEVVAAVSVPVVGNGDLLFPHEVDAALRRSGCAGVMTARGALIKPWIFREVAEGHRDLTAEERLAIYRRYVALALEHWRDDERGRGNVRDFTAWHLNFWCRYAPRHPDGSWPTMQTREDADWAQTPLDLLLARTDVAAHGWIAERLVAGDELEPAEAPALGRERSSATRREPSAEFAEAEG